MKKIVSLAVVLSMLISVAVTVSAENEKFLTEKYSAPDYAGAVFAGTVEDFNDSDDISLFSAPEKSLEDYIYGKLMDINWCKDKGNHYIYTKNVVDENGDKTGTTSETYIVIPISAYSVSWETLQTIMDYLVNEKGEMLINPLYRASESNNKITSVYVSFVYDISEIEEKRLQIKNKADEFIESLGNYKLLSQRERVLLTHDFIANNAYYAPSDINNAKYHTLYSALIEGVTVCQGYTQAMCYILNQIGVECVSCLNKDGNHVWNCVNVDGQWSHVDLTWDDARVSVNGTDEIYDCIDYNDFMTNAETMIENKKKGYSKYKGSFDKSEFTFPSGDLEYGDTEFESDKSEFSYNYLTYFTLNGSIIFLPSGFNYLNGSLVHTLNVHNGGEKFGNEYKFIYDSLSATNSAVSVPLKGGKGYSFLILPLKGKVNSGNISIYMADYDDNNINSINKLEIDHGLGTSGGMMLLKCETNENLITNANQAKFFFWDSNMRPYTQPTYKTV